MDPSGDAGFVTVMVRFAVPVPPEFVAESGTTYVPVAVGVPSMIPSVASRPNPGGILVAP
jgi:hypothetical protein